MREDHLARNGLNEWNRLPPGYVELCSTDTVQAGDVQKLNAEWFAEYPARGMLIGTFPNGRWFRKSDAPPAGIQLAQPGSAETDLLDRMAAAMARHSTEASTATLQPENGGAAHWRELAKIALAEVKRAAA
jgi:hypothetical protein